MTNAVGMKLVLIPPGEFDMGSTPEEVATELEWSKKRKGFSGRIFTEGPRHRVKITKPLYFGMYHTTQAEYEKVMGVNPSAFTEKQMKGSAFTPPLTESLARYREMIGKKAKGTDTSRHPVDSATWDEAAEFCRKLSAMPAELAARRVYRLPTEAEWEYACRAGTTTRWYCGDDEADVVGAAWFKTNADGTTHPVGLKKANAWGLYDMHGNANQWCADWCGDDYYAHSPPSDPTGPPYGSTRVARGGAYLIEPSYFRSAARVHCGPASRWTHLGFRVVADIATTGQAQRKTADSRRDQMPLTPAVTQTVSPGKESVLGQVAVDLGDGVKLEMLWIPAGEFLMGSPDSDKDARPDEKPQHRVRITRPFYLGKYLVTQAQWQAVMGSDPSHVKGPKNPVEMVSWNDCQAFLDKLNTKSGGRGGKFQLPTDAQWEYACRAGSTTRYCFGDEESGLDEFAWYGNSGGRTHPVGEKKPNAWGLYDMHGNVWEWCGDWLDGGYYARSPVDDPMGPTRGSNRVIRGGGWNGGAGDCRSALRSGDEPGDRDGILGFRVARVPAEEAGSPRAAPAVLNTVIDSPPLAIAPFDAAKARQHQEAWAKHLGLPVEQTNSIGMQFVLIPPGEFDMGSSAEEVAWLSERGSRTKQRGPDFEPLPVVRVKISKPFNVGIYHVTQGEYAKVMGVNPSVFCTKPMEASAFNPPLPDFLAKSREEAAKKIEGDTSRHPVDSVSWDDCLEFCRRLSALPAERAAGRVYRLPTQAEWEYTCRAGTTSVWYCGNDEADLVECAWLGGTDSGGMAHPVGQKRPNAWGLYDMYGNVAQWCADWLIPGHHKRPPLVDPIGLTTGNGRATRGGYYQMAAISSRSALFHAFVPTLRLPSIGFRVVCEIATGRPATTDQGPGKSGTPNAGASPGNAASPFPNPESPIPRPAAATFGARGPVTSRSMFRLRTPPVAHASGRECAPVPTGTDEGVALGIFNRPVPEGRPKIAQHVSAG
jgi:formylglycine-generating enzyme required for sulfatase activity